MKLTKTLESYKKLKSVKEAVPEISPEIEAMLKKEMKLWIENAFDKYNELLDMVAKINVRDDDFKKEWAKVDKAFDGMIKIYNKKYK